MNTDHIWRHIVPTGFCWEWIGCRSPDNYGRYLNIAAHRAVYEALVGPIPAGLEIDHLCRVTYCVNPDHLEPVTRLENIRRRSILVKYCKNGHSFTLENTRIRGRTRICRACSRIRSSRYQARKALTNA